MVCVDDSKKISTYLIGESKNEEKEAVCETSEIDSNENTSIKDMMWTFFIWKNMKSA